MINIKNKVLQGVAIGCISSTSLALPIIDGEDFETGFGLWMNDDSSQDNRNWTLNSGGTPSSSTGPSSASEGINYIYLETSSGGAYSRGDSANLISPIYDDVERFTFDTHMFGSNIGRLSVDIFDGNIWWNDFTFREGEYQTSNSSAYMSVDVDLSGYYVKQIRLRATAEGGYRGDIAIDNIKIFGKQVEPVPPVFVGEPILLADATVDEPYSGDLMLHVEDLNGDLLTFSKISGPDWLNISEGGLLSGTVAGVAMLQEFVVSVTDGTFFTETTIQIPLTYEKVLFKESFEGGLPVWENSTGVDTDDWTRHSGSTTSSGTGPVGASEGTYYTYLETSNGSPAYYANEFAMIESPSIDANQVSLSFDYHMYGADIGALHIDILSNGAWQQSVGFIEGQQHLSNTSNFSNEKIYFHGDVEKIRIRAVAVGGFRGDIAIDNLVIRGEEFPPLDDVDGDGIDDELDAFPFDPTEQVDTDNDGTGNNADSDDDNDGVLDVNDAFPLDAIESLDTDGDGIGNNTDSDDDNDGVLDINDEFPLDFSESLDTDNDGIGNNADLDDDSDGVLDTVDAFPLDASETLDTDGDGIGNNVDLDDDNDTISDDDEINIHNTDPLLADTDSDQMPDGFEILHGLDPLVDDSGLDPDGDSITNLQEFLNNSSPNIASKNFTIYPIASSAGIDGGSNQNFTLDGSFEFDGPFSKWIIEDWRSSDFTKKIERRLAHEFSLPAILLDNTVTIKSATLTATLDGRWGSAGLLSELRTFAYLTGNGSIEEADFSKDSLRITGTNVNNGSTGFSVGDTLIIDVTNYVNSLDQTSNNVVGFIHDMYSSSDRIDLAKDFTLNIEI